jgi:hypothetical protein
MCPIVIVIHALSLYVDIPLYSTTEFFTNITQHMILNNSPHHTGL